MNNDWISVKDRLPDKSGIYRIKGISGSIAPKEFEEDSRFTLHANGHGYWGTCFDWKLATHWKESKGEDS